MDKIIAKWHISIKEIAQSDWNSLIDSDSIPFYRWHWLHALEKSNSIIPKYGWQPLYLGIYKNNCLLAIAPLYLKGHSYGEFIFDNQFFHLASQLGINYYPKLVGMSPVSPIQGYKFLFSEGADNEELTKFMIKEIDQFCIKNQILSCNFLYVDSEWRVLAEKAECAKWLNQSSLWSAGNSKNFSDYLAGFNSNQRRNIKRERQRVQDHNIAISVRKGIDIDIPSMKLMHNFYQNHCARWGTWGSKYLSESFFEELASPQLREQTILFCATKKQSIDTLAMSLCITNGTTLWGRYWGSEIEVDSLHFELCYYSPIEWALENGIEHFDPGAGGSHKKRRGFIAQSSTSLHRWYNKKMDSIIRSWLPKVNQLMIEEIKATNNEVPFKCNKPKLSNMK